jgi:hypothetical protein
MLLGGAWDVRGIVEHSVQALSGDPMIVKEVIVREHKRACDGDRLADIFRERSLNELAIGPDAARDEHFEEQVVLPRLRLSKVAIVRRVPPLLFNGVPRPIDVAAGSGRPTIHGSAPGNHAESARALAYVTSLASSDEKRLSLLPAT